MSKTAYIFPGQGAQKTGMAKTFYDNFEISKMIFDKASEILGFDMAQLCFNDAKSSLLNKTEYTQCAMLTAMTSMMKVIIRRSSVPAMTAGLSLGEYASYVLAESLCFDDALSLVRKRGIYMENAMPKGVGKMVAVIGLDDFRVKEMIKDIDNVQISNYNCPGQIVISGLAEAVDRAKIVLADVALKCVELKVSGPFHSKFLVSAGEQLRTELDLIQINRPKIPVISNVTGEYCKDATEIKKYLSLQVSHPVLWEKNVRFMISEGIDTFVEIGPGKTLSSFIRRINRNIKVHSIQTIDDLKVLSI